MANARTDLPALYSNSFAAGRHFLTCSFRRMVATRDAVGNWGIDAVTGPDVTPDAVTEVRAFLVAALLHRTHGTLKGLKLAVQRESARRPSPAQRQVTLNEQSVLQIG